MQSDNSLDIINEYKEEVRILKGQIAELEDAGKSKAEAKKYLAYLVKHNIM